MEAKDIKREDVKKLFLIILSACDDSQLCSPESGSLTVGEIKKEIEQDTERGDKFMLDTMEFFVDVAREAVSEALGKKRPRKKARKQKKDVGVILFELTMPGIGSWNGKWTGEGKRYLNVRSLSVDDIQKIMHNSTEYSYEYDFGDGWRARIIARCLTLSEANKLYTKHSLNGFCGYEWMVDSIIKHGKILSRSEQAKLNEGASEVK